MRGPQNLPRHILLNSAAGANILDVHGCDHAFLVNDLRKMIDILKGHERRSNTVPTSPHPINGNSGDPTCQRELAQL